MAAKRKFPKAPKAGASKQTLLNYEKKCKEVKAHNDKIDSAIREKNNIRERVAKLRAR